MSLVRNFRWDKAEDSINIRVYDIPQYILNPDGKWADIDEEYKDVLGLDLDEFLEKEREINRLDEQIKDLKEILSEDNSEFPDEKIAVWEDRLSELKIKRSEFQFTEEELVQFKELKHLKEIREFFKEPQCRGKIELDTSNIDLTQDEILDQIEVSGKNKKISDLEQESGIEYPMHFVWLDNAENIPGVVKLPLDKYKKVYKANGIKSNPDIIDIPEYEDGMERPYYKMVDGETHIYVDGFSGVGTEALPFEISTAKDFNKIGTNEDGWADNAYYIQVKDIDREEQEESLYVSNTFDGIYDGQGYTISNNNHSSGLFTRTTERAVIKNIVNENQYLSNNSSGFICRTNYGKIANCTVIGGLGTSVSTFGGIASSNYGTIKECETYFKLNQGSSNTYGGIAGDNYGNIINCYANMEVYASSRAYYGGGIVGYSQSGSLVINSNSDTIIEMANNSGDYIGGFVGRAVGATFINCHTTIDFALDNGTYYGGFVGYESSSKFINCSVNYKQDRYDQSTNSSRNRYGGFVGDSRSGMFKNCYVTAIREDFELNQRSYNDVGLFAGYVSNGRFESCYAAIKPNSSYNPLGFAGSSYTSFDMRNCYIDKDLSPISEPFHREKLITTENMKRRGYMQGFDYLSRQNPEGLWVLSSDHNNGYPVLQFSITHEIDSYEDFIKIGSGESGYGNLSSYVQTGDIVIPDDDISFRPVGTDRNPFMGTYNGQGYKISNLNINMPSSDYIGLFGYIGDYEEYFNNLNNELLDIDLYRRITSLVIHDSRHRYSNISDFNKGQVYDLELNNANIRGRDYVGGIAGINKASISNCKVTDSVIQGEDDVGGFVGNNNGYIRQSIVKNTSVDNSKRNVGLFVGHNEHGQIFDSYSRGSVRGETNVGGFCGLSFMDRIYDCYTSAEMVGGIDTRGFSGLVRYPQISNFFNNYYNSDKNSYSGDEDNSGGEPRTTELLKDPNNFTEWRFVKEGYPEEPWAITDTNNDGFPELQFNTTLEIHNRQDFEKIGTGIDSFGLKTNYELMSDIDLSIDINYFYNELELNPAVELSVDDLKHMQAITLSNGTETEKASGENYVVTEETSVNEDGEEVTETVEHTEKLLNVLSKEYGDKLNDLTISFENVDDEEFEGIEFEYHPRNFFRKEDNQDPDQGTTYPVVAEVSDGSLELYRNGTISDGRAVVATYGRNITEQANHTNANFTMELDLSDVNELYYYAEGIRQSRSYKAVYIDREPYLYENRVDYETHTSRLSNTLNVEEYTGKYYITFAGWSNSTGYSYYGGIILRDFRIDGQDVNFHKSNEVVVKTNFSKTDITFNKIQTELNNHLLSHNYFNFEDTFSPIGSPAQPYTGKFNGNNYTVDNLLIYEGDRYSFRDNLSNHIGLFSYLHGSHFKNLNITNAYVHGQNTVGILAGYANTKLTNVNIQGEVRGHNYVGGVFGQINSLNHQTDNYNKLYRDRISTASSIRNRYSQAIPKNISYIENCDFDFDIISYQNSDYSGGIAGYSSGLGINNSTIKANIDAYDYIGGLFGYSTGLKVDQSDLTQVVLKGYNYIGGISGHGTTSLLSNLNVNADIDGNNYIGGLEGYSVYSDTSNIDMISFNAEGRNYIGGFFGRIRDSIIKDSKYNSQIFTEFQDAGGIAGYADNMFDINGLEGTYDITAGKRGGGLVGYLRSSEVNNININGNIEGLYNRSNSIEERVRVGGLIGRSSNSNFNNVNVDVFFRPTTQMVYELGGAIGYSSGDTLDNINVNYEFDTYDNEYSGGIAGYFQNGNLYNSEATGLMKACRYSGGLFGYSQSSYNIINNIANFTFDGRVNTSTNYIGGLAGYSSSDELYEDNQAYVDITAYNYLGGIAGYITNTDTFRNNKVAGLDGKELGRIESHQNYTSSGQYVGGLAGYSSNAEILLSNIDIDINSKYRYVGGLIGSHSGGNLSYNNINHKITGRQYVGGLTGRSTASNGDMIGNIIEGEIINNSSYSGGLSGYSYGSSTEVLNNRINTKIDNSSSYNGGLIGRSNNASVISNNHIEFEINSGAYSGGLIGDSDDDFITDCETEGTLVSSGNYVGGLVGRSYTDIERSFAEADVTGDDYVGGLVGRSYNYIKNCHSRGIIDGQDYVGGFCGHDDSGIEGAGEIETSYAINYIIKYKDPNTSGPFIGYNNRSAGNYNYYNQDFANRTDSEEKTGAIGIREDQMMIKKSFDTWDFETTWEMGVEFPGLQTINITYYINFPDKVIEDPVTAGYYSKAHKLEISNRFSNSLPINEIHVFKEDIPEYVDIKFSLDNENFQYLDELRPDFMVFPNESEIVYFKIYAKESAPIRTNDKLTVGLTAMKVHNL